MAWFRAASSAARWSYFVWLGIGAVPICYGAAVFRGGLSIDTRGLRGVITGIAYSASDS